MALCEVTLVLDQLGADKGIGGGEVGITRRLTRDGQSSYYLNGKPCSLRDIRELLMDTGVGTSAYSVIEQGRIGFILRRVPRIAARCWKRPPASAATRRGAKWPCANSTGCRSTSSASASCWVKSNAALRSVQRQAATALKYQELTAILKDLRLVFALEEFGRLSGERNTLSERAEKLQSEALSLSTRMAQFEAATSGADAELLELGKQPARGRAATGRSPLLPRCFRLPRPRCQGALGGNRPKARGRSKSPGRTGG